MAPRSKARTAQPSPHAQVPSLRVPSTSDEEFDLNVPNGDDSEDDDPPVQALRSAGRTPNTTGPQTEINDPTTFGKKSVTTSEYDFFFALKVKGSIEKRNCLFCT